MAGLANLNTYSTTDVSFQVETLQIDADEGATIELPLMAWTPIHDIGPLTGNGIQITHTFNASNITMTVGGNLTVAQYDAYVATNPAWPVITSSFVTANATPHIVANPINYPSGGGSVQLFSNNTVPIGTGDYTVEGWFYISGTYSSTQRTNSIYQLRTASTTWMFEHRHSITLSQMYDYINFYALNATGTVYRVDLWNTGIPALNRWCHFALVRSGTQVRIYVDGISRQINQHNGTGPAATRTATNITLTNTTNYNSQFGSSAGAGGTTVADQIMVTRSARYTANFTPPAVPYTYNDINTVILLQMVGNTVTQAATTPAATNRVIAWPPVELNRATGNAYTLSNPAPNTWTIRGIYTPEDYLLSAGFLNFPPDYYGNGAANIDSATGSWTTNIKNLDVSTYDYTYNVNFSITDTQEFDKFALANIAYGANQVLTLTEDQKARIADTTGGTGNYTLTLTTQSIPTDIQLAAANVGNLVTNSFTNFNGVGRLTLVGTKDAVNTSLDTVTLTTPGNVQPEMTYQAGGNILNQSTTVFTDYGVQPNIYLETVRGSLRFTAAVGQASSGFLIPSTIEQSIVDYLANGGISAPVSGNSYGPENPSTIEFWFSNAYQAPGIQPVCTLSSLYNIKLYIDSNTSSWILQSGAGGTGRQITRANVTSGWHHCAFINRWAPGTGNRELGWFLDGQFVGALTWPNVTPIVNMPSFGGGAVGNLDEFRISNFARYTAAFGNSPAINRINNQGYMLPLEVDQYTLGLWRIQSQQPGDNTFYNDRQRTVFDNGNITWSLTNPSGLVSNLQQYYYFQGY